QVDAAHLLEQIGAALEGVGDAAGQGGQPLDGGGEMAGGDARLLVEGGQALAAAAAVVVGAPILQRPEETDDEAVAVSVIAGGLLAVGAGYAGAFVAVFLAHPTN